MVGSRQGLYSHFKMKKENVTNRNGVITARFLSLCKGSKPEALLQINILMLNLLLLGFKAQEIEDYY